MNKKSKSREIGIVVGIAAIITLIIVIFAITSEKTGSSINKDIDRAMNTTSYFTEVVVNPDNTYDVREKIDVSFEEQRHGIYRNIPEHGYINVKNKDGEYESRLYFSEVTMKNSNIKYEENSQDDYTVYRFGDEDETVDHGAYDFTYNFKPEMDVDCNVAAYNVFPAAWKSAIPKGSGFQVTFPKDFDHSLVRIHYGNYGETMDASHILDLKWEGNTLKGVLKQSLPAYQAITFTAEMPEGYFEQSNNMQDIGVGGAVVLGFVTFVLLLLFLVFGIDKKIKEKACYYAPEGIDSVLAGYLVDGDIDKEDLNSAIYYLASKGLLSISTENTKIIFKKEKEITDEYPQYLKSLFYGIFTDRKVGEEVGLSSLEYKYESVQKKAKLELEQYVKSKEFGGIYRKSSMWARGISIGLICVSMLFYIIMLGSYCVVDAPYVFTLILSVILYGGGIGILCYLSDKWYALRKSERKGFMYCGIFSTLFGIIGHMVLCFGYIQKHIMLDLRVPIITFAITGIINVVLVVFMKKRTKKCVELLNELLGFRRSIEERRILENTELIYQNPDFYYDIIPYAIVFGLLDEWLDSLGDRMVKGPNWYRNNGDAVFSYLMFRSYFASSESQISRTCNSIKLPESTGGTGSGGFGGGIGGGGFSGGGFGGGGGGSW